jgi:hypothetical protein
MKLTGDQIKFLEDRRAEAEGRFAVLRAIVANPVCYISLGAVMITVHHKDRNV